MKEILYKVSSFILILTILFENIISVSAKAESLTDETLNKVFSTVDESSYSNYISQMGSENESLPEITSVFGDAGLYLSSDNPLLETQFTVKKSGWYNLEFTYLPDSERDVEQFITLRIDDKIPFSEAEYIKLPRRYLNDSEEIDTDVNGNQFQPLQIQNDDTLTTTIKDYSGRYANPYLFYLTEGSHVLSVKKNQENIKIISARFYSTEKIPSYEDKKSMLDAQRIENAHSRFRIEGEDAVYKSDSNLYPTSDKLSAATSPSDPVFTKLNTIGINTWNELGQTLTWEFNVEEDGYYALGFKVRQNYNRGLNTYRKLTIDGEIPFSEAESIAFPFSMNWYAKTFGDDEPYAVYLFKGKHTVTLEVTLGNLGEYVNEMENTVYELNNLYRSITKVTGATVDTNRDYSLEIMIPNLLDDLKLIRNSLEKTLEQIETYSGTEGSQASFLNEFIFQIDKFTSRPRTIPGMLDSFKSNISALSDLVTTLRSQPLDLDYIEFYPLNETPSKAKSNFFEQMWFDIRAFVASFMVDYSTIGVIEDNGKVEKIEVWAGTGRDQANVLRRMCDDDFTKNYNIGVNINLVDSSTIISASLAGETPDVVIGCSGDLAVDMAFRNIVADMTEFKGFEALKDRFYPSAFIPFEYEEGIYAVPMTQDFSVMFYRTDIFKELNLEVPKTWQEMYEIISILQQNGLTMGIPNLFTMLLYQMDSAIYTDDLSEVTFDTLEALEAMKMTTDFYVEHSLPLTYDFYNRFRTGEMPIGITSYSFYNSLTVMAPELNGYWEMAAIPGIVREDGTINNTVLSDTTGVAILKNSSHKKSAYDFVSWFTDANSQTRYGIEMENILGSSARYTTANKQAISQLPWDTDVCEFLLEQFEKTTAIPNIPASYIVSRNQNNAFRAIVYDGANVREVLNRYGKIINEEIKRKNAQIERRREME